MRLDYRSYSPETWIIATTAQPLLVAIIKHNPKAPCSYMVYTWDLKCYMGTPVGPKYILKLHGAFG